eukprot:gene12156-13410_t
MPSRFDRDNPGYPMETFNNGNKGNNETHVEAPSSKRLQYQKRGSDNKSEIHLPGTHVPYELRHRGSNKQSTKGLSKWKRSTFNFLEGHPTFGSRLYNHAVIFIILGSIGFAVASTIKQATEVFRRRIRLVTLGYEVFIFLVVFIEYTLRIWSCSTNSSYIGRADALVIISSLVLIVTLGINLQHDEYRYLLLLQLLRVLRIDRHRGAFATFKLVVKNHFKELLTCWYMGFIVIMFLSYITYADPTAKGDPTVTDLANGLYWGVVSMTTIGYGDVSPVTGLSKLILCIFALMGAGFIAMPAGIIGSGFALQVIEQRKLKEKTRRRRPAAELIQGAWKVYASVPSSDCPATWQGHTTMTAKLSQTLNTSLATLTSDRNSGTWQNIDLAQRELTIGEKHALGFVRRLKLNVAVRNFKQSTRPYDVKDILDRFAATHVEIFERIKEVKHRVDDNITTQEHAKGETEDKLKNIEEKLDNLTTQLYDVTHLVREILADRYIQSEEVPMPLRKKGKSPPFLSQEFIIQNHGDIASCFCMVFLVGLMFQGTRNAASVFVTLQHNVTKSENETASMQGILDQTYTNGWMDICGLLFYSCCWIVVQAIIQEYILDKINRRFHMSKTKTSKFNDSGNMLPFFIASIGLGIDLLIKENIFAHIPDIWVGYPHVEMSFMLKLFFLLQISYWVHMFPELFFMKARKEEIPEKVTHYSLYTVFIASAYCMNFTRVALLLFVIHYIPQAVFHASRVFHCAGKTDISYFGFSLWSFLFVIARLVTMSLAILTFWFGLGKSDKTGFDMAAGNFNNSTIRLCCLLAVVLLQAWMAWNFIMFQVKRFRERSSTGQRKSRPDQKKRNKKDKKSKEDTSGDNVQNGSPKSALKED